MKKQAHTPSNKAVCHICGRVFRNERAISSHLPHCKHNIQNHYTEIALHRNQTTEDPNHNFPAPDEQSNFSGNEDDVGSNAPNMEGVFEVPEHLDFNGIDLLPEQEVYVSLLYLMEKLECPHSAFEKIVEWARTSQARDDFDFCNPLLHQSTSNRRNFVKSLFTQTRLTHLKPNPTVPVPQAGFNSNDNHEANVVTFQFEDMLNSLLTDPELTCPENLVMNPQDPFGKYVAPNGLLGEINTGKWYRNAYDYCVKDPETDFLCPIILFIDQTHIDTNTHFKSEPVLFTASLFKRNVKNKPTSWRPLGYVQERTLRTSTENMPASVPLKNWHKQMETILKSFKAARKSPKRVN